MAAPKTKTAFMSMFGRKELILKHYSSIKSFQKAAAPWIEGVVPVSSDSFARILDNEPCTPEQATAVELAIDALIDRPRVLIERLKREYTQSKGKKVSFEISKEDLSTLELVLRDFITE